MSHIELRAMIYNVTIGASVKPRVFGVMNARAGVGHHFTIMMCAKQHFVQVNS